MLFKDIVENKTVAIVGNAASLLKMKKGSEIDSHDIVIRINKPGNIEYDDMLHNVFGRKMDIWCFWNAETFIRECTEKYYKLFLTSKVYKIEAINMRINFPNVETLYTEENKLLEKLQDKVLKQYPLRFKRETFKFSTGFMLINYLSNTKAKSISIYGMDFKATPTFYDMEGHVKIKAGFDFKCGHDYRAEKKYIVDNLLITNKNIRLIL